MGATNIFYRIPSQRGTKVATLEGPRCTLHQFLNYIEKREGLNRNDFTIASGTKVFTSRNCMLQSIDLKNNSHIDILIPLLGGKGGFGSLLRAIGAQIEKTTNRDACRDLSGRRLRDIKRDDELKKLLALQEKLQEERKKRRREKLERLKKKTEESTESAPIQELIRMFNDNDYTKRRMELSDILEAAVDKGIINIKKRQEQDQTRQNKEVKESDKDIEDNDLNKNDDSDDSVDCIHNKSKKLKTNHLWLD